MDSAYWLGFLLADGNITPNKHGIRLRIQASDSGHLRRFCDVLGYDVPIRAGLSGHGAPIAELEVNSRPLVRKLEALGWFSFKRNGDVNILDVVPTEFRKFLLRGLFDGDGGLSLCLTRRLTSIAYLSFHDLHLGVVLWFRDQIVSATGVGQGWLRNPNASHSVEWRGNKQVQVVVSYLYSGGGEMLARKHLKSGLVGSSNSRVEEYRHAGAL